MNTKTNSNNYSQIRNEFRTSVRKSKLTTAQKCVAFILADYTNNNSGLCYPSMITLSADASIAKKTVSACIKELERAGFVEVIRNKGKSNHYKLQPAKEHQDIEKKERSYNTENLIQSYSPPEPDEFDTEDCDAFDIEMPGDDSDESKYSCDDVNKEKLQIEGVWLSDDVGFWTREQMTFAVRNWEGSESELKRHYRQEALERLVRMPLDMSVAPEEFSSDRNVTDSATVLPNEEFSLIDVLEGHFQDTNYSDF